MMTVAIAYPSFEEWQRGVPKSATWPTALGFVLLIVSGFGFGLWAVMAPLASAVVASGVFVATGQNKQLQHLEGGIIREILAKEGEVVEAGQPLIRLDETAARTKLQRLVVRQYRVMATLARLDAEVRGSEQLELSPGLVKAAESDPSVRLIVDAQRTELRARRTNLLGQEEVLRKEIGGLQETIRGYQGQVNSNRARVAYFDEELKAKKSLLDQNLIRKSDVLALQRSEASLSGELGELLGRIGDAKERIARAEQQIVQLRSAAIQRALEESRSAASEHDDLQEQINAARDILERVEIRAPVRGIIVKMYYHTPGGVIPAGGLVSDLLPLNDELVIEARVNPNDIPYIKEGQAARVRLTALNHRLTPMVQAKVLYVSADTVMEQSARAGAPQVDPGKRAFVARVKLDEADVARNVENFRPVPGMPADVYIETGQRTFFTYLMRPLIDSFSRAFRER